MLCTENKKKIGYVVVYALSRFSLDTYVQAVSDEKRKAQSASKVVEMIMPGIRKAAR